MKILYPLLVSCLAACSQNYTAENTAIETQLGADTVKMNASTYYQEEHRPQFHFTPEANWMNDPNGMVYFEGEYHLFYQYYPDASVWGPMHWGHAISKDMVHWEHMPIAIYPDKNGWIFSGSAVADLNNTSGLGSKENPPLIAIFTYHNDEQAKAGSKNFQTQGIAYSLDKGRSWTAYENNPVLIGPNIPDFRDPKVSWYEPDQKWVMTLAVDDHVSFYSSKNLIDWQHESDFGLNAGTHGGVWECPDLIKMQVEGSTESKYVLLVSINPGGPNGGSATQYFVGDFDGKTFKLDPKMRKEVSKQPAYFPEGKVFDDFEKDLSKWLVTGNAFAAGTVAGNYSGQTGVSNFVGKRLVNSFYQGDEATGEMLSSQFKLEHDFINFYIGGGNHPQKTAINLLVDGQVVKTATGQNTEKLSVTSWDVSEFEGKTAQIQIVDKISGSWGHINIDHIEFADEAAHGDIEPAIWLDYGTDNYAGVTWSNVPEEDGRHLFIGWMSNWLYAIQVPTEKWRSAMTIPRSLSLHQTQAGYRLTSAPVEELKQLRGDGINRTNDYIQGQVDLNQLSKINASEFELNLNIKANDAQKIELNIGNQLGEKVSVVLDRKNQQLILDRTQSGKSEFNPSFANRQVAPLNGELASYQLHVFQDTSSIEIFLNQGETVMTALVFPNEEYKSITLNSDTAIELTQWEMYRLNSIWKE